VPRSIPVPPRTIRSLRTQKARVAEIRLHRAGAWQDEDRVFPGTWGEAADRSSSGDRLADVAKSAGLGHATVRQLRHSVATELLRQGIPMKVVQDRRRRGLRSVIGPAVQCVHAERGASLPVHLIGCRIGSQAV
jgi:integrase